MRLLGAGRLSVLGEVNSGADPLSFEPVEHALPAGQAVHSAADVRLVAFEYEPSSHGSGALAPSMQYEPSVHVSQADAWDHVAGLTVGQDISDRAVQLAVKPPQMSMGKSFDTFSPIGQVMVSKDTVKDLSDMGIT